MLCSLHFILQKIKKHWWLLPRGAVSSDLYFRNNLSWQHGWWIRPLRSWKEGYHGGYYYCSGESCGVHPGAEPMDGRGGHRGRRDLGGRANEARLFMLSSSQRERSWEQNAALTHFESFHSISHHALCFSPLRLPEQHAIDQGARGLNDRSSCAHSAGGWKS